MNLFSVPNVYNGFNVLSPKWQHLLRVFWQENILSFKKGLNRNQNQDIQGHSISLKGKLHKLICCWAYLKDKPNILPVRALTLLQIIRSKIQKFCNESVWLQWENMIRNECYSVNDFPCIEEQTATQNVSIAPQKSGFATLF